MNPFAVLTDHLIGLGVVVIVLSAVFAALTPFSGVKGYFRRLVSISLGFVVLIWMAASIGIVWGDFLRSGR
jgi:hypothetical protein